MHAQEVIDHGRLPYTPGSQEQHHGLGGNLSICWTRRDNGGSNLSGVAKWWQRTSQVPHTFYMNNYAGILFVAGKKMCENLSHVAKRSTFAQVSISICASCKDSQTKTTLHPAWCSRILCDYFKISDIFSISECSILVRTYFIRLIFQFQMLFSTGRQI